LLASIYVARVCDAKVMNANLLSPTFED